MLQETTEGNTTIATLSFTGITAGDEGEYSCIMLFQNPPRSSVPFRSSVNTIRVVVSPGKLYLHSC